VWNRRRGGGAVSRTRRSRRAPEQLTFARYRDVAMPRWHDRGVVYLGDAAHGCNDAALADYSRRRARHLGTYQFMTRALTPLFQSRSRVLGLLRDLTFPIANALPPLQKHMIRTMAGVSRGFGRKCLPLVTANPTASAPD
jgi:2-polyprenyl-6-methoxyphenol hydroxylase-like FAD-dependent oxidoreductase